MQMTYLEEPGKIYSMNELIAGFSRNTQGEICSVLVDSISKDQKIISGDRAFWIINMALIDMSDGRKTYHSIAPKDLKNQDTKVSLEGFNWV
jgi:hypothetical protein